MARTGTAMPPCAPRATLLRAAGGGADAVFRGAGVSGVARIAPQRGPGRVGEARVIGQKGVDGRAAGREQAALAVHRGVPQDRAGRVEGPRELVAFVGVEGAGAPW